MAPIPSFKLNTGALMPAVALGGWGGMEKEERENSTKWMLTALKSGYRSIDTAWAYGTEAATGRAIVQSGLPREELFITTKLHNSHGAHVEKFFQDSLNKLGLDYVDLYLLHWPQQILLDENHPDRDSVDADGQLIAVDKPTFSDVWADMEKIYKSGRAKAIGVSNFSIKNLEKLLETATVVPAVNQVEMHPFLAQPELKAYCDKKGILITAYTPTGYKNVLTDPTITALAEKYGVSPGQIVLGWHVARGVTVACKSADTERQKQNIDLPNLDPEDVKKISALDKNERLCNRANSHGKVWGWTYEQLGW